jgi:hypothetical protein
VSLKTLEIPNSIPVTKAASAWGIDPQYLNEFASRGVMTSAEIKKFVMKATTIACPGKSKPALREFFTRFMVLSLRYPLIEDLEKGILQLLDRDYLKPEDELAYRTKVGQVFGSMNNDWNSIQKYVLEYFRSSSDEYIAQIPRHVFIETALEMPAGSHFLIDGKLFNTALGMNLSICGNKLGSFLGLLPIADRVSREIIESNPLVKSLSPVIGSLRMRKQVADSHTKLAVGG